MTYIVIGKTRKISYKSLSVIKQLYQHMLTQNKIKRMLLNFRCQNNLRNYMLNKSNSMNKLSNTSFP